MRCWALLWTMLFLLQVHAASMSMGSAGPSHQSHSDEGLISANRRLGLLCRKKRLGAARQIFKDLVVEQITPDVVSRMLLSRRRVVWILGT